MVANSILITGANRGLGLEFVKQFLGAQSPPKHVIATCRDPSKAKDLANLQESCESLHVLKLEAGDMSSFENFSSQVKSIVGDDGLNLLINNAGMNPKNALLADQTKDDLMQTLEVNVAGPLFLSRALLPLLRQGADKNPGSGLSCTRAGIVNISSIMASNTKYSGIPHYSYRTSKAALNMAMTCLSHEVSPMGVLVACVHPGWVQTDMGGPKAAVTPENSIAGMIKLMGELTETGWFGDYTGETYPF